MKRFNKRLLCFTATLLLAGLLQEVFAQEHPLEIKQPLVKYNRSFPANGEGIKDGVPFDYRSNANVGNFTGSTILSGWRTSKITQTLTDTTTYTAGRQHDNIGTVTLAEPQSSIGAQVQVKMKWAMIGAPLVARPVSFLIGSAITSPSVDENYTPIQDPKSYWRAMPHTIYEALSATVDSGGQGYEVGDIVQVSNPAAGEASAEFMVAAISAGGSGTVSKVSLHKGGKYISPITSKVEATSGGNGTGLFLNVNRGFPDFYWSPHANRVFAFRQDLINITWRRKSPVTDANKDPNVEYVTEGTDNNYALMTHSYVISGAPSKPTRKIYWTEKQSNGPLVTIPAGQVNAVKITYNSTFPERVDQEVNFVGQTSPASGTPSLGETRTLWYEYGGIHAYNIEGRTLVEYLGPVKQNGIDRVHLGLEIVDVIREAQPVNVAVNLGEPITPYNDGKELDYLYPLPVNQLLGIDYLFDFTNVNGNRRLYAIRETQYDNDVQVYWMEEGLQKIKWPKVQSLYSFSWPKEASKYSHYARLEVTSDADARKSAVQLSAKHTPVIEYQTNNQQGRAKITVDRKFYTWLGYNSTDGTTITENRALIRFLDDGRVWFERVYSFVDDWAENPVTDVTSITEANGEASVTVVGTHSFTDGQKIYLGGATGENAVSYNKSHDIVSVIGNVITISVEAGAGNQNGAGIKAGNKFGSTWFFDNENGNLKDKPTHLIDTAIVGSRIDPPDSLFGVVQEEDGYWAGHITTDSNGSYNPNAYVDPLSSGFEQANRGAIIPVNARSNERNLKIWWFRKKDVFGFDPIYWPSVIGKYSIIWPHEKSGYEAVSTKTSIVLASNDGSGPLNSLQAKAQIYRQYDSSKPGFNPNEEHALMIAGQAYALRNDLNHFNQSTSSQPYVLLDYIESDGRPAMRAFKVLAEDHENKFDYKVSAGTILQAPMPLPLLGNPILNTVSEDPELLNVELDPLKASAHEASEPFDKNIFPEVWGEQDFLTRLSVENIEPNEFGIISADQYRHNSFSVVQNIVNNKPTEGSLFYVTKVNNINASPSIEGVISKVVGGVRFSEKKLNRLFDKKSRVYASNPSQSASTAIENEEYYASLVPNTGFIFKSNEFLFSPVYTQGNKKTFAEFKLNKDVEVNEEDWLPLTGEIKWKTDNGYQVDYWSPEQPWSASGVENEYCCENIFGIYVYAAKLQPAFLESIEKKFINKAGVVNKTVFLIDTEEAKNWNPNNLANGKYDNSGKLVVTVNQGKYYYYHRQNTQSLKNKDDSLLTHSGVFEAKENHVTIVGGAAGVQVLDRVNEVANNGANNFFLGGRVFDIDFTEGIIEIFIAGSEDIHNFGINGAAPNLNHNYDLIFPENSAKNKYKHWRIAGEPLTNSGEVLSSQSYTLKDKKGNLWVYRGPNNPNSATEPFFSSQYFYKILDGFDFPEAFYQAGAVSDVFVGKFTPYLDGNASISKDSNILDISTYEARNAKAINYYPSWPDGVPVLKTGQTLTTPVNGLPSVRGQSSLQILYQQSRFPTAGSSVASVSSVILYDGAVGKTSDLSKIPGSVKSEMYRGKTYFPNLPPHLVDRFYYDPNLGEKGKLVFKGEFVDSVLGEDYLLPNVASDSDLQDLYELCSGTDNKYQSWVSSLDALSHRLVLYVHNRSKPDTYHARDEDFDGIPDDGQDKLIQDIVSITDDDQAADSYALTANGPGIGYVTLLAGNGSAFTPVDDPVSVHVIKVVPMLHNGELKVIQSDNPLSEKLTMQQVVDFAGKPESFDFEWKIAAPVDSLPPEVHKKSGLILYQDAWQHVPFPLLTDFDSNNAANEALDSTFIDASGQETSHSTKDVTTRVVALSILDFSSVNDVDNSEQLKFTSSSGAGLSWLRPNAKLTVQLIDGNQVEGTVNQINSAQNSLLLDFADAPAAFKVESLFEGNDPAVPQSLLRTEFTCPPGNYKEFWLSMNLDDQMGVEVYIDGTSSPIVVNRNAQMNTPSQSAPGILKDTLNRSWKLVTSSLTGIIQTQQSHSLTVKIYSNAMPGISQPIEMRLHAITQEDQTTIDGSQWKKFEKYDHGRAVIGTKADVTALSDNYLIMRYKAKSTSNYHQDSQQWSQWTEPQLAEGWIKRVMAGITPFNQRSKNLFDNRLDTGASMLSQAGPRWEGDVALNMDNIDDFGLIEIYETVLNRGKMLSIDYGINYGPANDALLLAAGYINDLYMILGNEAAADAANPTIGIGTSDGELGSVATALFAFKGQVPSLLEEELGLLRGRDDFLQPGVRTAPAYNRLFWNYTRGIDSGEVIYALNYNITEDEDQGFDGLVNAEDAQKMYPQSHGDAYGHYLTALKGYYHLLVDEDFTWAPRTEAVLVLGKPVQVDYQDERKFATAAAAVARSGNQVVELTWREEYKSQKGGGWKHFSTTRYNSKKGTTRHWGMDHWASRTGAGSYLNWVVGNAILPEEDNDPEHEGIQEIDRQTVPELLELVTIGEDLQITMDNAEVGLNPLGLDENSIAMDIDPHFLEAGSGTFTLSHFDQVYTRAMMAMNNAAAAFDDAKGVTEMMRSDENYLDDFKTQVAGEELSFKHELIDLYGTPYPDDVGPGKTYPQGYDGPDLYHHMYVDTPTKSIPKWIEPTKNKSFWIDAQLPPWTGTYDIAIDDKEYDDPKDGPIGNTADQKGRTKVEYNLDHHGFFEKPDSYKSKRSSPGELQSAISAIISATNSLREALENHTALKYQLDREIELFEQKVLTHSEVRARKRNLLIMQTTLDNIKNAVEIIEMIVDGGIKKYEGLTEAAIEAAPINFIAGMAVGGDLSSAFRSAAALSKVGINTVQDTYKTIKWGGFKVLEMANAESQRWVPHTEIGPLEWKQEQRESIYGLDMSFGNLQMSVFTINEKIQELDETRRAYSTLIARGNRIQASREIFRQRSSAIVQGLRTRDAGFRIFRNEKLERYKTLFDLAARYTYLATKAYDYETGLLHTETGKDFLGRIVNSRALGLMADGEPQFAGSDTGDPGLSSVLAEMKGDYEVLRGRLGFNNPDTQGTTLSLRLENHRILPGIAGEQTWKDVLHGARRDNLLDDADVTRHCMQIDTGNGLPVPGLILEFRTTIEDGYNLLGRPLAGGDSHFSPSNFATKIHGVGIGLENYVGMDVISTNGGSVDGAGGASPSDPNAPWLDPQSLSKTPHVYLIPVGQDIMRSPPLGDASVLRSWNVKDVTIPLPFNVGASEFSARSIWQTKDILSEELFAIRKHQAFRAVLWEAADGGTFSDTAPIYAPSKIVNNRLVGRSVWNTKWKLVIPGKTLLNDPEEGLDRFINSVSDIKVHFETYSYSGN